MIRFRMQAAPVHRWNYRVRRTPVTFSRALKRETAVRYSWATGLPFRACVIRASDPILRIRVVTAQRRNSARLFRLAQTSGEALRTSLSMRGRCLFRAAPLAFQWPARQGRGLAAAVDLELPVHDYVCHPNRGPIRIFISGQIANLARIKNYNVGECTGLEKPSAFEVDSVRSEPGHLADRILQPHQFQVSNVVAQYPGKRPVPARVSTSFGEGTSSAGRAKIRPYADPWLFHRKLDVVLAHHEVYGAGLVSIRYYKVHEGIDLIGIAHHVGNLRNAFSFILREASIQNRANKYSLSSARTQEQVLPLAGSGSHLALQP